MEGSARNTTLAAMNTNVRPQEQTRAVMEDGDLPSLLRACDGIGIDHIKVLLDACRYRRRAAAARTLVAWIFVAGET